MHGTTPQRALRLLGYLASHPTRIPGYVAGMVGARRTPLDLGLPWIAGEAIEFLEQFVASHHRVAELGGGGSTVFFARRAAQVLTIESSNEWADRLRAKLDDEMLANVLLKVHPYDPKDAGAFATSEFLAALGDEKFDVILVDNYDESAELRPIAFARAEEHISPGGIIVLDDAWRYAEPRRRNRAKRVQEFRSTGPCRPGVTTTEVYFY